MVCKVFRPFILHTLFPSFPSGYQSLFLPYSFFPAHVCFCLFVLTTRTHLAGEPCSSLNSLYSTFPYLSLSLPLYNSPHLSIYLSMSLSTFSFPFSIFKFTSVFFFSNILTHPLSTNFIYVFGLFRSFVTHFFLTSPLSHIFAPLSLSPNTVQKLN